MTTNQISLAKVKEDQRHNLVSETETVRHNIRSEQLSLADVKEKQRSHLVSEAETHRSNVASELLGERKRLTDYEIAMLKELPLETGLANPMTLEVVEHLLRQLIGHDLTEGETYSQMGQSRDLINTLLSLFLPEDIDLWALDGSIENIQQFIRRGIYGSGGNNVGSQLTPEEKDTLAAALEVGIDGIQTSPEAVVAGVKKVRSRHPTLARNSGGAKASTATIDMNRNGKIISKYYN